MKLNLIHLCVVYFGLNCCAESYKLTEFTSTTPEKFPYQISVFGKWFCGAILITKDYVIAPAHCLNASSPVEVYLGFLKNPSYSVNLKEANTQIFNSREIIFHDDYHQTVNNHFVNDIALVKLPEPATLNSKIQPGILMSKAEAYLHEAEYGTISGWKANVNSEMQFATEQILNQDTCRYIFGSNFLGTQEICTKAASVKTLDLIGDILKVNGKILGYLMKNYNPSKGYNSQCEEISVFLNLIPYLSWISEKVGVPIEDLTGHTGNILSEHDKMKEEIKALKTEMENTKNQLKDFRVILE